MRTMIKTVSVLAIVSMLSGCIIAHDRGPGAGWHHDRGNHHGWHHHRGR
ncbi:hypothetical protein C7M52_00627 [Mixta theicola]|nr:hypothetical protein [Mixta theicola]QHM74685.1 hypothetical protein C7M52_00627 [Mixta theicola]